MPGATGVQSAEPKSPPALQAIPLPGHQVSFVMRNKEVARYHFGPELKRPFVFPIIGPGGGMLTRMGHPRDPESHSHHNSVWVSHQSVSGINFWEDRGAARIAHQRVLRFEDSDDRAFVETENLWLGPDGRPLLRELRRTGIEAVIAAPEQNTGTAARAGLGWMLQIDLHFEPAGKDEVTLGQTPFGVIGVRMAKSIGVNDGGGTIRNSEGGIDEAGCFRKPARWCDYSGFSQDTSSEEGITLMDHPLNLNHPVPFHVRNDGWMGAAVTFPAAHVVKPGQPLRLRYGLYVHGKLPPVEEIEAQWQRFARSAWTEFARKK